MLELKLLGSPQILLHGHPLTTLSSVKSQALLFYLALNGRPQSRLALAELLWPEKREADALGNLRQAVYHLRNALPNYLDIHRATLACNQDLPYAIDVIRFEKALDAAPTVAAHQAAVDQYTGEFLAGFFVDAAAPFDAWAVVTRERLHRRATETLHDLVAHFGGRQETEPGLHYVNQLLALEPWREQAHRHKMQLLVWSGQTQAALAQYAACRHVLATELGAVPASETVALYEQIRNGEIRNTRPENTGDVRDQGEKLAVALQKLPGEDDRRSAHQSLVNPKSKIRNPPDGGEMPTVHALWGRAAEMRQLEAWLVTERQRLVVILGMGGMGKTTLAAGLVRQVADRFTHTLWRSLINAPPLADILRGWVQTLTGNLETEWPAHADAQLALLFDQLRRQPCLLVLDNVESILRDAAMDPHTAGAYRSGYAEYGQFFLRMAESPHRSCLLLTSRELPQELVRIAQNSQLVRLLTLPGLALDAGQSLFAGAGLVGTVDQQQALLARYSGNPLALQLMVKTIQDFFAGDIAAFLSDETLFFADIRQVLDQQFARLAPLEQALLLWLAIEREPVTLPILQADLARAGSKSGVLEALLALQRRSLLEKTATGFTLHNVILEYATAYLVEKVCGELETATLHLLHSHALRKTQAKEYVRQSQARMILQPISERLQQKMGRTRLVAQLKALPDRLRQGAERLTSYAGGNILNLLLACHADLQQADFSNLAVWQADLRGVYAPDVNFRHADLTHSLFTDTFTAIYAVAFSPRGKRLAAGTTDGQIRTWQAQDGQLLLICSGHTGWITAVAYSPDGQWLASSSDDQTLRLWDSRTGQCLRILQGHTAGATSVRYSPDGQQLASSSDDQTVRLWDVHTGQCLRILLGHADRVLAVDYSPDGQWLVTGSRDQTVRLWDIHTGQCQQTMTGHTGWVLAVCASADGRWLASGGTDQTVRLWDRHTGECMHTLRGHKGWVTSVRFSPDGQRLVSSSNDQTVRLWDVHNGQCWRALSGHTSWITAVCYSPDGQLLASGSDDQTVRLWDSHTGQCLQTLQGHTGWTRSIGYNPDGQSLASGGDDQLVRLWDSQSGQCRRALPGHTAWIWSVGYSPDGQRLASGSTDQTVRVWNVQSGQCLHMLSGHTGWVRSICFAPDGQLLASGSTDQTIRLWNSHTGHCRHTLHGHTDGVLAVCFSPNGQLLASSSDDKSVRLWDTQRGQPLASLPGHTGMVLSVCFSPDGQWLASGSDDKTVRVWSIASRQCLAVLTGHTGGVGPVCFSPDGQLLASGSNDQTICLWRAGDWHCLTTLRGHTNRVSAVVFSPDGRTLVSCSADQTIKRWDRQTGQCQRVFRTPGPYVGMDITGVTGITAAQKAAIKALGATDPGAT